MEKKLKGLLFYPQNGIGIQKAAEKIKLAFKSLEPKEKYDFSLIDYVPKKKEKAGIPTKNDYLSEMLQLNDIHNIDFAIIIVSNQTLEEMLYSQVVRELIRQHKINLAKVFVIPIQGFAWVDTDLYKCSALLEGGKPFVSLNSQEEELLIAKLIKNFKDYYNVFYDNAEVNIPDISHFDDDLKIKIINLIEYKNYSSAIREGFIQLTERMRVTFNISSESHASSIDGVNLVNTIFGKKVINFQI